MSLSTNCATTSARNQRGYFEEGIDKPNMVVDLLEQNVEKLTGNGAITIKNGKVLLNKAGVLAATLALPTAGTDDGKVLEIVSQTAQAHTVTTPATGIDGTHTIGTFGGAIGDSIRLIAEGGFWWPCLAKNVTIS